MCCVLSDRSIKAALQGSCASTSNAPPAAFRPEYRALERNKATARLNLWSRASQRLGQQPGSTKFCRRLTYSIPVHFDAPIARTLFLPAEVYSFAEFLSKPSKSTQSRPARLGCLILRSLLDAACLRSVQGRVFEDEYASNRAEPGDHTSLQRI